MNNKRYKIAMVDDDIVTLNNGKSLLQEFYKVYTLQSAATLFELLENDIPDLILLDLIMPEVDGFETIKKLKADLRYKDIPVIFLTAVSDEDSEMKGFTMGAVDYIIKPFTREILRLRVHNQIKIINQMNQIIEQEIAEKSSRSKIEFLININHEMLTPMNAIIGMTQIAQMAQNPKETTDCLDEIDLASQQLLGLIHDLLNISGNKADAIKLDNSVFSFRTMFQNILKKIDRECKEKQQEFTHEIDPSIPLLLLGDAKHFTKVVLHLLANAIKFTPEQGKIHFSAFVLGTDDEKITLQIEITDSGIGIPKEQQIKIFNPFEHADKNIAKQHGGFGLGLAISKQIIEMMGGEIWVESEPGKGSKFVFTCTVYKANDNS